MMPLLFPSSRKRIKEGGLIYAYFVVVIFECAFKVALSSTLKKSYSASSWWYFWLWGSRRIRSAI